MWTSKGPDWPWPGSWVCRGKCWCQNCQKYGCAVSGRQPWQSHSWVAGRARPVTGPVEPLGVNLLVLGLISHDDVVHGPDVAPGDTTWRLDQTWPALQQWSWLLGRHCWCWWFWGSTPLTCCCPSWRSCASPIENLHHCWMLLVLAK